MSELMLFAILLKCVFNIFLMLWGQTTHQMVTGWPVNFIVDADPGLVGLQGVREAADLQNQEVHGVQDFLAVHHPVSQTLQLSVAHRAW